MLSSRKILLADGWIFLCFPDLYPACCRVETLPLENLGCSNPKSHSSFSCYDLIPYHLGLPPQISGSCRTAFCSYSSLKGRSCAANSVLISGLKAVYMVSIAVQLLKHLYVILKMRNLKVMKTHKCF